MATETITLSDIKTRSASDYGWIRSGSPLSGYTEVLGAPSASVVSGDENTAVLDVTTYFEGRLCKPEFRIAKDLQALAVMVDHIGLAASGLLISTNDVQTGYLTEKLIDGDGILATIITASNGYEELSIEVRTKKSIEIDSDELQLVNDRTTPGSLQYYGTNSAGIKGWHGFSETPEQAITITAQDESADFLDNKITGGDGILTTVVDSSNGTQTLDLSVQTKRSIEIDSDELQLVNDELAPGNSQFYGTSTTGVKGWLSLPIKNSIEQESQRLQLVNDELAPGNSQFYGTTVGGVKGWQDFPIKNSIEKNSEQLQLVNDSLAPGNSKFYGTSLSGTKGWLSFTDVIGTVSIASDDVGSNYLDAKITDGDGLLKSIVLDSTGTQSLDFSVRTKKSIEIDSDELQFVNDEDVPGNSKFYGTDLSGNKGWHNFTDAHMGSVSITIGDAESGYLDDKIVGSNGISTSISTDTSGDQTLDFSVVTQNSIDADTNGVKLLNDEASPGNNKYYGTNGAGVKGWYDLP